MFIYTLLTVCLLIASHNLLINQIFKKMYCTRSISSRANRANRTGTSLLLFRKKLIINKFLRNVPVETCLDFSNKTKEQQINQKH